MKVKLLVTALTLSALALQGCGKKENSPTPPVQRPPVVGPQVQPHTVVAPVPAGPLIGSWVGPCVDDFKVVNLGTTFVPNIKVYNKAQLHLSIQDGAMKQEKHFYVGSCHSADSWKADKGAVIFTFTTEDTGSAGVRPAAITYTSVNGAPIAPYEDSVSIDASRSSISFSSNQSTFTSRTSSGNTLPMPLSMPLAAE